MTAMHSTINRLSSIVYIVTIYIINKTSVRCLCIKILFIFYVAFCYIKDENSRDKTAKAKWE